MIEGNSKPNPTFVSRSPAAVSVERLGADPGVYTVNFDRDVSACAYSVSTTDTLEMVSVESAAQTESKPGGVSVQVNKWVDTGEPPLDDTRFTIAVFC